MLNHVRTLLLNLDYDASAPEEHIPLGYESKSFPAQAEIVRSKLIPLSSRWTRQYYAHQCLSWVQASGLTAGLSLIDSRISYRLEDHTSYFQVDRISIPTGVNLVAPDTSITVYVNGNYTRVFDNNMPYEVVSVTQQTNTNNVVVESRDFSGNTLRVYQTSLLSWVGSTAVLRITDLGLVVYLTLPPGRAFTDSSDKSWTFVVEHPLDFDFEKVYSSVMSVAPSIVETLKLPAAVDVSKYDGIWKYHGNKVYKLGALVISLTGRLGV